MHGSVHCEHMVALTLVGCLLMMTSCQGRPSALLKHNLLPRNHPFRVCGHQLVETIASVCVATGFLSPSWDDASKGSDVYWDTPIGIVEECCYKPCSYSTLMSYCTDDERKKIRKSVDSIESDDATIEDISSEEVGDQVEVEKEEEVVATSKRSADVEIVARPRSAPVFGTVAPEYLRQPRTLDDIPLSFFGFPGQGSL